MKAVNTRQFSTHPARSLKLPGMARWAARWQTAILAFLLIGSAILASIGLYLAGTEVFGAQDTGEHDLATVGEQIATSFGTLRVGQVDTLSGLTSEDLGGVTHGIQNLVLIGNSQVSASVMLTNQLSVPYLVEPDRFHLKTDASPADIPLTGATIKPGQLVPGASIEATFTFVVPSNGSNIWLEFQDRAAEPIKVALGQVDHPSQEAIDAGQHSH